eukprot:CAMPEP_0169433248 /NCGR_PEP_ID=MMETSP1042-20121227/3907_1 /TAXON_ID=464988 /ORGANISM="Hemiselmis andersenii, Strain CCMP1180" /LENGTH=1094 /DNA_ID=CAMNT_0009543769 /DNA_START=78 /DNA_END=3358 /DNA_ORIENTATION=-
MRHTASVPVASEINLDNSNNFGGASSHQKQNSLLTVPRSNSDPEVIAAETLELKSSQRAWFYPEFPLGSSTTAKKEYMKGASFLQFWDCVTAVACMYVAWAVPYKIGFLAVNAAEHKCHTWTMPDNPTTIDRLNMNMAYFDLFTDIFFCSDIIVRFHTAYWYVSVIGRPHWVLVERLDKIRMNYIGGVFLFDLLGIIPVQYIDCVFPPGSLPTSVKSINLIRLVKLLRLHRFRSLIQKLKKFAPKSAVWITLGELLLTLMFVTHWMACGWFNVGYTPQGWVTRETNYRLGRGEDPDDTTALMWFQWISSFYWSIATMSTIGYGDITADTARERTLASVGMVVGCVFFALLTGSLTRVLVNRNASKQRFEEFVDELTQFLHSRNVPQEARFKVLNFYSMKFPNQKLFNELSIMEDLPEGLRNEISTFLYKDIVEDVPILKHMSAEAKLSLCQVLKPSFHAQNVAITVEGEEPDSLFIIRFGTVKLYSQGKELCTLYPGDIFGENAILGLSQDGMRTRTAIAESMVELCTIRAEEVLQLLIRHKSFQWSVQRMCKMHITALERNVCNLQPLTVRQLTCIDWRLHSQRLDQQVFLAKKRDELAGILTSKSMVEGSVPGIARRVSSMPNKYGLANSSAANALSASSETATVHREPRDLITAVQLQILSLAGGKLKPRENVPSAGIAFIKVRWAGDGECGKRGSIVGLSQAFEYEIQDEALVAHLPQNGLNIELWMHTKTNSWAQMPDFKVSVCVDLGKKQLHKIEQEKNMSIRGSSIDAWHQSTTNSYPETRDHLMSDEAPVIGIGALSVAKVIQGRDLAGEMWSSFGVRRAAKKNTVVHRVFLDPKLRWHTGGQAPKAAQPPGPRPPPWAVVQPETPLPVVSDNSDRSTSTEDQSGRRQLDLNNASEDDSDRTVLCISCSVVRRLPKNSGWRKVMETVRVAPGRKYFVRRNAHQLEMIKSRTAAFTREVYRLRRNMNISTSLDTYSEFKETMHRFDLMEESIGRVLSALEPFQPPRAGRATTPFVSRMQSAVKKISMASALGGSPSGRPRSSPLANASTPTADASGEVADPLSWGSANGSVFSIGSPQMAPQHRSVP